MSRMGKREPKARPVLPPARDGKGEVTCPFCKRRMRFKKTAGEWIEDGERPPFHILYQKRLLLCPEKFTPR